MPTWGELLGTLKRQRVPDTDGLRRTHLDALAKLTGRSVILYASAWTGGQGADPSVTSMGPEDIQGFMEVMHGLPTNKPLDLILHLPGGSPEAADAIVKYVRSKFTDVRAVVPHAAMSAATMLSCSANKILMGKHSSLGPIDPQLLSRSDGGGLSVMPAQAILDQFEFARRAIKADPSELPIWLPMLRQYGPSLLIQSTIAVRLAETLTSNWLETYMFAGKPTAAADAKRIASHLSNHSHHMSHGRFIARDECKGLGLDIEDLESSQPLQDAVLSVFHATMLTFNLSPAAKLLENHIGKTWMKMNGVVQVRPQRPSGIFPMPTPAQP